MEEIGDLNDISDVTHTTAFQTLDYLVEQKKILQDRSTFLKAAFKTLHDKVLNIYNNDNFLLKRAKLIRKELDNEKAKVEKCAEVAKEDDTTIQKLKRELGYAENELSVAQEKESMLQVETIELDRKKTSLQNEVDDAIAEEESRMRPTIDALSKAIEDLKNEIETTANQFDKYKAEREEVVKKEQNLKDVMDKHDAEIYEKQRELMKLEKEPERAKKQADIVERATQTAEKELRSLQDKIELLNSTIVDHETRKKNMEEKRYELALTLETQRAAIEQRQKTMDTIERNLETEKDSNSQLVQQSAELEIQVKSTAIRLNKERDLLNKVTREKEAALKQLRRLEQQKRDFQAEKDSLLKQSEILNREKNRVAAKRQKLKEDTEELKRDVDILINNYLKEEFSERERVDELKGLVETIKKVEQEIARKAEEEQEKTRFVTELSIHRETKSRDASKNKAKVAQVKDELQITEVVVKELQKRNNELLQKLQQLTEMYSVVKRERSNKAALIQSASQAMSETQEKIKILDNELEVLRRESLAKDKALGKTRRELHDERTNCENLRIETNKLYAVCKQKKKVIKEKCSQLGKLSTVISMTEEEMLQLKKKYESAVEDRNFAGIQLIDRNDELCILYEKGNIQENILRNGQKELQSREEEARAMSIQLGDIQREIETCQKQLPKVREAEEELDSIMKQLDEERWRVAQMQEELVNPESKSRWRKLEHVGKAKNIDSETPEQLAKRQQELEQNLNHEIEKLMEASLVLEELDIISAKFRTQATQGRDPTLQIARKVNDYQTTMKRKTKKIMAVLSELSMRQAQQSTLQSQVDEKRALVEEAKEKLVNDEAPTEEMEVEFYKSERDMRRKKEIMLRSQLEREQQANMPSQVTRTTAVPRPNAYLPVASYMTSGTAEPQIPKPYGNFAPVQKSKTTPLMKKCCRAPNVREVEL